LEASLNAVVVLFRPFPVRHAGLILGWIVTVIVVALYTLVTAGEYLLRFDTVLRRFRRVRAADTTPRGPETGPEHKEDGRGAQQSHKPNNSGVGGVVNHDDRLGDGGASGFACGTETIQIYFVRDQEFPPI
jgi:hypothetical protein